MRWWKYRPMTQREKAQTIILLCIIGLNALVVLFVKFRDAG